MPRLATAAALLLLVGCTDPVEEAQKRVEFLKENHATYDEVCDAARDYKAAAAAARDQYVYSRADVEEGLACNGARLYGGGRRYGGDGVTVYGASDAAATADRMEAEADAAATTGKDRADTTPSEPDPEIGYDTDGHDADEESDQTPPQPAATVPGKVIEPNTEDELDREWLEKAIRSNGGNKPAAAAGEPK
ncbi:MAG TPA: hypothetical protein VF680_11585 [Allosphingosinicella sp.]|jgi:hypothetical protein